VGCLHFTNLGRYQETFLILIHSHTEHEKNCKSQNRWSTQRFQFYDLWSKWSGNINKYLSWSGLDPPGSEHRRMAGSRAQYNRFSNFISRMELFGQLLKLDRTLWNADLCT